MKVKAHIERWTILTALLSLFSCPFMVYASSSKNDNTGRELHLDDSHATNPEKKNDAGNGDSSSVQNIGYGLDVSMPIQHRVSTNYPWLPHNADPTSNPIPAQYVDMPLQVLGNRQRAYTEHLEGCRAAYGPDANQCDIYEYDRILMNLRQPQSMQNYTKTGFKKIRAPETIAKLAEEFWQKNQLNQVREKWPKGSTYTNHWKAPTYMVSVDDKNLRGSGAVLKRKIWGAARETLQDWTRQDLTHTSMYGIRVYTEGAVLVPHVDRLPLVSSAMINVAQDVDEDWPMEIYDHDGRAHNVTLHPGDMLLFESHSAIHGRPFPLKGRYYAMLFIHFEPTGHSLRHSTENPVQDVSKQYKEAIEDRVGGQSAAGGRLPPYIIRESPEEAHWRKRHPNGWSQSAAVPSSRKSVSAKAVHRAAAEGNVKAIEQKISKTERKEDVINERDDNGWQPIHEGAAGGHKDVVELLVNNGADVNARTAGGLGGTPLFIAVQRFGSHHPIVRYLYSLGALNVGPEL